jgi:hypothetical protein
MKKTLFQFLAEKEESLKCDADKFKDLDCSSDDLTDEEREHCEQLKFIDFMRKSNSGNS